MRLGSRLAGRTSGAVRDGGLGVAVAMGVGSRSALQGALGASAPPPSGGEQTARYVARLRCSGRVG